MSHSEEAMWSGDWASLEEAQRQSWRAMSAADRLTWLEEALTFAYEAGALDRDRERRAEAAREWGRRWGEGG